MLKQGDKITVHFYNPFKFPEKLEEERTRQDGTIYTVEKVNGKLGITYSKEFVPFEGFASCVGFKDTETGKIYHYSNLADSITDINE